jgi:hypothetical protein
LQFAYRTAGRWFFNHLAATFLVLVDGAQPVVNFFVPTPPVRPTTPVTDSVVVGASSLLATDTRRPPPVVSTYLQRTLSAPISTGSGRKRPTEASQSAS